MNRIDEIIYHETAADAESSTRSAHRWQAAKLIYEEVESGKTKYKLAQEIGKSQHHVRWSARCWDLVGKHYADGNEFSDFPNFNDTYHSDMIRGDQELPSEERKPRSSGRSWSSSNEAAEPERDNAPAWVAMADEAARLLDAHPITWQLLTEDDRIVLKSLPGKFSEIAAAILDQERF